MLKIVKQKIEIGQTFQIRNSWREKIAEKLNKDEEMFPFYFKVIDIEQYMKDTFYVAESISEDKTEKSIKIKVSETILNFLLSDEVADSNVGLYFNDYLPLENTKILILDNKNALLIHPVLFKLLVDLTTYKNKKVVTLDLVLENLLTNEVTNISSQLKNSWKFLFGTDDYMTDVEKMYQDTFIHKDYVLKVCNKFAKYLIENDSKEIAEELLERAKVHDNSKILNKDEFRSLTGIINDKSCLKDASSKLSQFKQDSIELHWKHNEHHPEHFDDVNKMTKLDKMEMCCDWCARAMQYNTNLLEFVEKRQEDRFHFPELMYDEIYHYCKILISL